MRSRRPTSEHQEAVSRRLALLSAELATVRPEGSGGQRADFDSDAHSGSGQGEWWEQHTRVSTRELPRFQMPAQVDPEESVRAAPLIPIPGRHASRRAGRVLGWALPATLRGRLALGPGQVAVVAVLVALGLAATCWWIVRGDAAEGVAPLAVGASPTGDLIDVPVVPAVVGTDESGSVTVDIAGRVRHPGIAVLDAGSRVIDALEAAGGSRPGVDLAGINLARLLVDGEQILVGRPAPTGTAASVVPTPGAPAGPLVNLNAASQAELETLPEVGPVTALAIISWRDEHGGFNAIDELLEVDGIGDATLGQLAPFVTV